MREEGDKLLERHKQWYEEYCKGKTFQEVADMFGVSRQAVHQAFKARGWETRGAPKKRRYTSKVRKIDDSQIIAHKAIWDVLDAKAKGTIAENYVTNKLMERGYDVWKPVMNNHRTDLGVIIGSQIVRIQVKTASYDINQKRFRALMKTKRHGEFIEYKKEDADVFIIYCPGIEDVYVIPAEIAIDNNYANLMPHRERVFRLESGQVDFEVYKNALEFIDKAADNRR